MKITLPTILHNEELKEKLEEFDCLIEIYNRQQETQKTREFEDTLIIHQKGERILNWFMAKAKVLEKAESNALSLQTLDQVLELLKDSDQKQCLRIKLQKAHLLLKL